jgi:hypothetical protein
VLIEHVIYSTAIAILLGMIYRVITFREYSWIIILSAYAPDVDAIINRVLLKAGITLLVYGSPISHGDFHTLAMLAFYALGVSFLLHPLGIRFVDSLIFSAVGFGAHLVEDALVFSDGYRFLWPLVGQRLGIGILAGPGGYEENFYGIADTAVLGYGIIFLAAAVVIRTWYERKNWMKEMISSDVHR